MKNKFIFCVMMAAGFASFATITSCVDSSYNFDDGNINTDITIGGDNLTITLGKTKETTIAELLDFGSELSLTKTTTDNTGELKTDSEGFYYYELIYKTEEVDMVLSDTNVREDVKFNLPTFLYDDSNKVDMVNSAIEVKFNVSPELPEVMSTTLDIDAYKGTAFVSNLNKTISIPVNGGTFWLAGNNSDMPEGATFVELPVNDIINSIPDRVVSDIIFDVPNNLTSTHKVSADMKFYVPLAFGKDTEINYEFDEGISFDDASEYLGEEMTLIIKTLKNTIPFDVKLDLSLFDENGNPVEDVEIITTGLIKANSTGDAEDDLTITVKEKKDGAFDNISNLKLKLKLVVAESEQDNVEINEKQVIQLEVKLKLTGGINLSLD